MLLAQRKVLLGIESNSSLCSARVYDGVRALLNVTGREGGFIRWQYSFVDQALYEAASSYLLRYTVCVHYRSSTVIVREFTAL